jgi:membrane protease YdiL (CAAX protease family)
MWIAVRHRSGRRVAILVTAACFAVLHVPNGALVLELPHRFAMGLALGRLRDRTGSLAACAIAHALLNVAATALR